MSAAEKREMTPTLGQRLMDEGEAAEYLHVSVETMRDWRKAGRRGGPDYIQIGGRSIRYLKEDLDRYISRSRVKTPGL
jgi:excisionase family DNA binding protein